MRFIFLSIITTIFFGSCTPEPTPGEVTVMGYAPVYASVASVKQFSIKQARAVERAGKIYAFNNFLFQNDIGKGIHIIDNSDRTSPRKIAFIDLPFSTEVAVKGNYLYSNNYNDIVVFNISDPTNPQLVKRLSDVFPPENQRYPPFNNVSFECPDASKGIVVRWDLTQITNPKCRR